MTVIAWDGKTLAADKRSTLVGLPHMTTKIVRARDGSLIGAAGDTTPCRAIREWYCSGADPSKFPDKDGKCDLVVITTERKVLFYTGGCSTPVHIEDPIFATGSGRDFALSAMHFGKDAKEAVEFACRFDVNCGNGIDTLTFETPASGGASQPETGDSE